MTDILNDLSMGFFVDEPFGFLFVILLSLALGAYVIKSVTNPVEKRTFILFAVVPAVLLFFVMRAIYGLLEINRDIVLPAVMIVFITSVLLFFLVVATTARYCIRLMISKYFAIVTIFPLATIAFLFVKAYPRVDHERQSGSVQKFGTHTASDENGFECPEGMNTWSNVALILFSYLRPKCVFRALFHHGRREDRALMYLMVSCLLLFVAQWPRLMREAEAGGEVPFQALLAGALFGWLFVAPLVFFGIAALLHLVLRALRQPSSWHGARAVLFWSLLSISPLMLFHGLLLGYAGPVAGANVVGFVVLGAFLYILIQGLRELAADTTG